MSTIYEKIQECDDKSILINVLVELKSQRRNLSYNKNHIKWMHPFHRKFQDNKESVIYRKNQLSELIDLCDLKIKKL